MAIRWEKLTVKAQEAVQRGNDLASEHGNPELLPLHLLAALLEDKEGIILPVLEKIGIGPQAVAEPKPRSPRPPTTFWNVRSRKRPILRTSMFRLSICCLPSRT
jgi:hypothetical protein